MFAQAQELNCIVKVSADQAANNNVSVFKTLEKSLNELVNKTKWTTLNYKNKEKIDCSMFLNITNLNNDQFEGTIQIQSSRPVFNSTFSSPVYNYNDKDLLFKYTEFEPLLYNANSYDSNLISIIAFHANMIIAMDADTFSMLGGNDFLRNAQEIVSIAQQGNMKGWNQSSGTQNRFFLINDLLSNQFVAIRETLFDYHFKGLDKMVDEPLAAKEVIKNAILNIEKVNSIRPNAFVTRVFFDAKSDEIVSVFSGGPKIDIVAMVEKLNRFSPTNTTKWADIKF